MARSLAATAGAALGTAPPAPTLSAWACDSRGQLNFGSGTLAAAGVVATITLPGSWSGAHPAIPTVQVNAMNAATVALGALSGFLNAAGNTLTITCQNAPGISQAAGTYAVSWLIQV